MDFVETKFTFGHLCSITPIGGSNVAETVAEKLFLIG